ncbi:MAG: hypothetical protein B7Y25_00525 [Alphaproteobacteria bacterium 16-39-46]|nr:MAG: hypothetical protein B7Y25_00525 [Alphaproteobacteria bacterium 16-39-46]OZA44412.1 MAG: hypothetical protein B7X84_00390 [Alphaproteobacteria bacterium 17-39-52]HQS83299.1 hypothetical protein [Alphaproteobacteria bacterium]HQS93159.1 hypothetical protein [Alphaproteobacteria bacterium]
MNLNKVRYVKYLTLFFCLFVGGCSSSKDRLEEAQVIGKNCGFESQKIQTSVYDLMMFLKRGDPHRIHLYLEGDGFAWFNTYEIAEDPTPEDPTGFRLACEDLSGATIVYLTRPCHYGLMRGCTSLDWTFGRFSQKILDAYFELMDALKAQYQTATFQLYGYSGGGFLALLLGENRSDITKITTFAGNLDHAAWTAYHGYSPLTGSLTVDDFEALSKIEQIHYTGVMDTEIPFGLSKTYKNHFKGHGNLKFIPIEEYGHVSDWPSVWAADSVNNS